MNLIVILFAILGQILAVQFGFLLTSTQNENGLDGQFVAFGSIPEGTSETDMQSISDDMNQYYRCSRRGRNNSAATFAVTLVKQATQPGGNLEIALKGSLSNFSILFRCSICNCISKSVIWDSVRFYSDPIIIMSPESFAKCPEQISLTLLRAAFDKVDIISGVKVPTPTRTFSQLIPEKGPHPDNLELSNFDEDDDNRYITLEFYPLQFPLVNPKRALKPKSSRCGCCAIS